MQNGPSEGGAEEKEAGPQGTRNWTGTYVHIGRRGGTSLHQLSLKGGKKYFRRSDLVKEDVSPSDGKDSEGSSTKDEPSKVYRFNALLICCHSLVYLQVLPESHSSEVGTTEQEDTSTVLHLPRGEVVRRLRERGEPIRLFGESDKDVCLRLRQIELLETDTNKVGVAMCGWL